MKPFYVACDFFLVCHILDNLFFHFEIFCKLVFSLYLWSLLEMILIIIQPLLVSILNFFFCAFEGALILLCWVNVQILKRYFLPKNSVILVIFSKTCVWFCLTGLKGRTIYYSISYIVFFVWCFLGWPIVGMCQYQ